MARVRAKRARGVGTGGKGTDWERWRSREQIFVKPFKNSRQQDFYRTKDGKVIPAESLRRTYEKQEEKDDASA